MDKYSIEIVSKAEKEFLKLPESARVKIHRQILLLEDDPKPFGHKETKRDRILQDTQRRL